MSQNESTPFLVTYAKNLTLIDATRENSPWWVLTHQLLLNFKKRQANYFPTIFLPNEYNSL